MASPITEQLSIRPAEGENSKRVQPIPASASRAGSASFQEVLRDTTQSVSALRFSKHAQERLAARGLSLNAQDMQRLEGAVEKAAAKGSRDSLVLMDDLALVVSVRNRTVITAVDAANRRDSVFTNIDSVVLAERTHRLDP